MRFPFEFAEPVDPPRVRPRPRPVAVGTRRLPVSQDVFPPKPRIQSGAHVSSLAEYERLYRDSRCGSLMLPWTAEDDGTGNKVIFSRRTPGERHDDREGREEEVTVLVEGAAHRARRQTARRPMRRLPRFRPWSPGH